MDNIDNCKTCGAKGALEPRGKKWIIACLNRFRGCPMNARTHMCSTPDEAVTAWNTRSPVTDEMVEVRIGILGCDDSTYLTRQMTKEQFTFLEEVAEQISEQSTYGCMPVMNAALTAALGGPHG